MKKLVLVLGALAVLAPAVAFAGPPMHHHHHHHPMLRHHHHRHHHA